MSKNIDPIHEIKDNELPHLSDRSDLSSLYDRPLQKSNISLEKNSEKVITTNKSTYSLATLTNLIGLLAVVTFSISYIGILIVMKTLDGASAVTLSPLERLSGLPLAIMIAAPWIAFILLMGKIFSQKDINLGLFLVLYCFFVLPLYDIGLNIGLLSLSMFLYLLCVTLFSFVYIHLILKIIVSILNDRFAKKYLVAPLVMLICVWILAAIY